MELVLASGSPRRLDLLRQLGLDPRVRPADVEEHVDGRPLPEDLVQRLAALKGRHVRDDLAGSTTACVLAADTTVALDDEILNKPRDADDARAMLGRLAGRSHRVWTGVWVGRTDDPRESVAAVSTVVHFADVPGHWIDRYVATGEPMDKAGAYGIQGRGVALVDSIRGSWTNVVGLPLEHLPAALRVVGLALDDLADWLSGRPAADQPGSSEA